MSQAEIVSSTGGLGLDHRTYDRYYLNSSGGVIRDITYLERLARIGSKTIDRERSNVQRVVGRFLISETMFDEIRTSPIAELIEAAVPTSLSDEAGRIWMILGGQNHPTRRPFVSVASMEESTIYERMADRTPLDRVNTLQHEGYRFIPCIPEEYIDQVLDLWVETFGWDRSSVKGLQHRLNRTKFVQPEQRTVWMTILQNPEGAVAAVAMAERLDLPVGNGIYLPVIENTEWRRSDRFQSTHGLMAATVAHLNAQVLTDLEENSVPPLIIAETNFMSRSDRVGHAIGMEIPPRLIRDVHVPQILRQNVEVVDGHEPRGLRDFTMIYLSEEMRLRFYTPEDCRSIAGGII